MHIHTFFHHQYSPVPQFSTTSEPSQVPQEQQILRESTYMYLEANHCGHINFSQGHEINSKQLNCKFSDKKCEHKMIQQWNETGMFEIKTLTAFIIIVGQEFNIVKKNLFILKVILSLFIFCKFMTISR